MHLPCLPCLFQVALSRSLQLPCACSRDAVVPEHFRYHWCHLFPPVQVSAKEAEAWCNAHGAVYVEMRSPEDIAALDAAIELLVRACVRRAIGVKLM